MGDTPQLSRAQQRQLLREARKLGSDAPDRYKKKLTTREDVAKMLAMHHREYVIALERRVEALERPWWRRLLTRIRRK